MPDYADVLAAQIQNIDFDVPFEVNGALLTVTTDTAETAPDVYSDPAGYGDPAGDVEIDGVGWEALTRMTGQYRYRGAIMHPSEYIDATIAERLVEIANESPDNCATFVVTAVGDLEDLDAEPAGWCILHHVGIHDDEEDGIHDDEEDGPVARYDYRDDDGIFTYSLSHPHGKHVLAVEHDVARVAIYWHHPDDGGDPYLVVDIDSESDKPPLAVYVNDAELLYPNPEED